MSLSRGHITVAPLAPGEEAIWNDFLGSSANGTLFHDLNFLRYHPDGRFRFRHLVLRQGGRLAALLPGGLAGPPEAPVFTSPLGASIGGFVVASGLRAELALAMVQALQEHARAEGWAGIEITLPAPCYDQETAGLIDFALFCAGFSLRHRWLCHVLPLISDARDNFELRFRRNQVSCVRTARRNGIVARECGIEALDDFAVVFHETYDRHGVAATHTLSEIEALLGSFPDRVRIHLAMLGGLPVAGLLVLRLTHNVANTFYICSSSEHAGEHGVAFVVAEAMNLLARQGFRYLDLGPSASDMKFNKGVTFFKEGLGAFGQSRDQWRWDVRGDEHQVPK